MIVKQVQTIVFSKEEKETLTKAADVIRTLCNELGGKCSRCPFNEMCDEAVPSQVLAKLGYDGQLIVED